jgi:hypothetical protein
MEQLDKTAPSPPEAGGSGALWMLLPCAVAAIAVALVPCASLLAQGRPVWLVVGAGLAVFPLLPLLWHGLAEATASARAAAPFTAGIRFALRSLAIALVVLAVSLGNLGPPQAVENVRQLFTRWRAKPVAKAVPLPPPANPFGLEPFIPADATLAVGLAGSAAMEQLLAVHGVDTREKLAALSTCKIDFTNARVLIATRGSGTHLIVVRAPGITEERNLYCLVGVMGPDRLQVLADGNGGGKTLQVKGLLSRPLIFRVVDPTTMMAIDETWQDTAARKLFAEGGEVATGLLALPLGRVNRGAPLWVVSVAETTQGIWDLAIDSREEGSVFKLQGTSTPPSGEKERAEIVVEVPLAFASSLPESAATLGIRGVVTAIAATGASPLSPQALPAPASSDAAKAPGAN